MAIKFDAEITLDDDYLEHTYADWDEGSFSVEMVIRDAISDIWESHRFGISLTAKNVSLDSLEIGGREDG